MSSVAKPEPPSPMLETYLQEQESIIERLSSGLLAKSANVTPEADDEMAREIENIRRQLEEKTQP